MNIVTVRTERWWDELHKYNGNDWYNVTVVTLYGRNL